MAYKGLQKQLQNQTKDQQRLQRKKDSLETECNQLKQEKAKLQNQIPQDTEQYQKLCKEKKEGYTSSLSNLSQTCPCGHLY